MNHLKEVYIQFRNHEPKPIQVDPDETLEDLLARLRKDFPEVGSEDTPLALFAEEDDDELPLGKKFCECRPKPPRILHCHQCKKIEVSVSYNGHNCREFGPNAKIRRITKWAIKQFGVDESRKWTLRSGAADGQILEPDTSIGSLVSPPSCKLSLFLAERCQIPG